MIGDIVRTGTNTFRTSAIAALQAVRAGTLLTFITSPVLPVSPLWELFSGVCYDICPDSVWIEESLTEPGGYVPPSQIWAVYSADRRITTRETPNGYIEFLVPAIVTSIVDNTTYATITVTENVSQGYRSWSGGATPDASISGQIVSGGTSIPWTPSSSGPYDLERITPQLGMIRVTAPDPSRLLIRIFDQYGTLLTEGYPNSYGYFNPIFTDTQWVDVTMGSPGCPGALKIAWPENEWPILDGIPFEDTSVDPENFDPATYPWVYGDYCYGYVPPPTPPVEYVGDTYANAAYIPYGDLVTGVTSSFAIANVNKETGSDDCRCVNDAYYFLWFWTVPDPYSNNVMNITTEFGDTINIEHYRDDVGAGDVTDAVYDQQWCNRSTSGGLTINPNLGYVPVRIYFRISRTSLLGDLGEINVQMAYDEGGGGP